MFRGNFNIHLFRKQIASESMLIFFFLRCTFLTVTTETDLVRDSSAVRRLFFLLEPWDVICIFVNIILKHNIYFNMRQATCLEEEVLKFQ